MHYLSVQVSVNNLNTLYTCFQNKGLEGRGGHFLKAFGQQQTKERKDCVLQRRTPVLPEHVLGCRGYKKRLWVVASSDSLQGGFLRSIDALSCPSPQGNLLLLVVVRQKVKEFEKKMYIQISASPPGLKTSITVSWFYVPPRSCLHFVLLSRITPTGHLLSSSEGVLHVNGCSWLQSEADTRQLCL